MRLRLYGGRERLDAADNNGVYLPGAVSADELSGDYPLEYFVGASEDFEDLRVSVEFLKADRFTCL